MLIALSDVSDDSAAIEQELRVVLVCGSDEFPSLQSIVGATALRWA